MSERVEHYSEMCEELDLEELTVLVVAGATVEDVKAVVLAEAGLGADDAANDDEVSFYGFVDVAGGVLAMEHTGYADPSVAALLRLSAGARSAAVVRDNIQAHLRFGAARDGTLLFDDDEFTFIDAEDRSRVPDELRPLFDLAWVDVDSDDEGEDDEGNPIAVALAMAEATTGVVLTLEDLERLMDLPRDEFHRVRTLRYAVELES